MTLNDVITVSKYHLGVCLEYSLPLPKGWLGIVAHLYDFWLYNLLRTIECEPK